NPTGWDFTNGLGAPVGDKLATDVAGSTTPVATSNTSYSPTDQTTTASAPSTDPCVSTGSYLDPAGDVTPFTEDTDLTGSTIGASLSAIITNGDMIAGPGDTPADLPFIIDQLDATSCPSVTT